MKDLYIWFDTYIESKIGRKVLRHGDVYDDTFNSVIISVCICFSESEDLINKFGIHYHPYGIISNTLKKDKTFIFLEIDKLRLKKGIDKILNWQKEVFTEFEFYHLFDSMQNYWDVFKKYQKLSRLNRKYYFKIPAKEVIKSNKGLSNTIF